VRLDENPRGPGVSCALLSASRSNACCARPLGRRQPPWSARLGFTAEPRITANTRSLSLIRVAQAFEHHGPPQALTANERPFRRRAVERAAAPGRRHEADLGQRDHHFWRQDQRHATRQRGVAVTGAQALTGQVNRDQRRRARGLSTDTLGPAQIEQVRQAGFTSTLCCVAGSGCARQSHSRSANCRNRVVVVVAGDETRRCSEPASFFARQAGVVERPRWPPPGTSAAAGPCAPPHGPRCRRRARRSGPRAPRTRRIWRQFFLGSAGSGSYSASTSQR